MGIPIKNFTAVDNLLFKIWKEEATDHGEIIFSNHLNISCSLLIFWCLFLVWLFWDVQSQLLLTVHGFCRFSKQHLRSAAIIVVILMKRLPNLPLLLDCSLSWQSS